MVELSHQSEVLGRAFDATVFDHSLDPLYSGPQLFNQLNKKTVSAGLYYLFKYLAATGTGLHHSGSRHLRDYHSNAGLASQGFAGNEGLSGYLLQHLRFEQSQPGEKLNTGNLEYSEHSDQLYLDVLHLLAFDYSEQSHFLLQQ